MQRKPFQGKMKTKLGVDYVHAYRRAKFQPQ